MGKKRYVKGLRIHRNNLASSTIRELLREVHTISRWQFSPHFEDKSKARKVKLTREYAYKLIKDSKLIEFHTLKRSRRVLLRNMPTGISIIVDLDAKVIVSVWRNELEDDHRNLDTSRYLFG
jgi:hypothetical protein